ncbi:MAG: UDP-glucose 4-epimerase GalE [Candidatus Nitrotoga sp.]|nr:UDP-glucose 4-epimerase GalE [Candidatus Nitrotoga sp.]MDO9446302.1 UDP-glucose 4-epimerase GalE [Candidatus Nitrotoga sp.]MDP1638481.1 UDP-glucose 4-epimerase GalE [Candidatus Nitrotoga sp.]MDP1856113.1 UDP-glucose 4-epimerase GalE [Candidatus Nitrotoga sp.]MDP3496593.1 UDP-glucose 4-epimerase GalE [Candidatus Nitrotoga sp.]
MILVTGGTGYIGSHTVVELMLAGFEILIVDNFCNSKTTVLDRIERIVGRRPGFVEADIRDRQTMQGLFARHHFDAVIHFAGLKAVGESVAQPLRYYDNNVYGSLVLFEMMAEAQVKTLVFSSSATVYGDPATVPILENFPLGATNPYGRSKQMVEEVLRDLAIADPSWRIALLRYFNPVGAHESGLIGEDPTDIPNNLLPYIAQVAQGQREMLSIYGDDYPTVDGTGMRDYIHVVDLAIGHVKTLEKLIDQTGVVTYNLGTGRSNSVLEMVRAFEQASGRKIPYKIVGRRPGDIAICYADTTLAERDLGWKAERTITQMCADSWRWQSLGNLYQSDGVTGSV